MAVRTLHVALNHEHEYTGGRLVFATAAGLSMPARPAGSATVHDGHIAHGVTGLQAGTRYSLFALVDAH